MEFITGLKQQEEAELEDLLKAEEGTTIILEGAVHSMHTIPDRHPLCDMNIRCLHTSCIKNQLFHLCIHSLSSCTF